MLADKDAKYLQYVVKLCSDRIILSDNKTSNAQHQQLKKLLDAVDSVISSNKGIPFSNQMFAQIKEVHDRQNEIGAEGYSAEEIPKSKKDIYDGYLILITKMVEEKLNSTIEKLQKQLMEEQKARQKLENEVAEAKLRSEEEIRKLMERLEKAQQDSDKAQQRYEKFKWMECAMM
uniref:AIG1-type G domain-containing protein n=1 Tax=Arundo donax TaxID=35708 RepID=A0A0A9BJ54_ARUDO